MTTLDRFDDIVAEYLHAAGPADIRPEAVQRALDLAATRSQRRGLRAWLGLGSWGVRRERVAFAVALAMLTLGAVAVLAGMLLLRPSPLGGGGWINVSSSTNVVQVVTPDGAIRRGFTRGHGSCPVLSPDGTSVAYAIRFNGLHVTRLADGTHRKVGGADTANTFGYREGVWSPDRAYRSYRTNEGGAQVLKVASVFDTDDPTSRTVLSTATDEIVSEAAWSADSRRIAVARAREGQIVVDILDLEGVVQQTVGPFPAPSESILMAWSPDGSRLAYVELAAGQPVVQVIDLAAGTRRERVATGSGDFPAASPWSHDGRWLAVRGIQGELEIVSADGAARTSVPALIGPNSSRGGDIKWSPTANVVAMRTAAGLTTVNADGTNRVDLQMISNSRQWGFDWSPDGSRIVVAEDRGALGGLVVTILDATGRSATVGVATYPSIVDGELCLSWDAPTNA